MKTLFLLAVIVFGFAAQFGLSRFLETNRAELPPEIAEENLFFKSDTLKLMSFGFDGLMADYYWSSALQYIGGKVVKHEGEIQIDNLKPLNPRLLYPMLDAAVTLDPQFTAAFAYASTVLPAIDLEQAIKISEKGIAAQPENWRMYHNLGFIYWRAGDFRRAADIYNIGAGKPNAPNWMKQMSAKMQADGGSRDTARQMYRQMYESGDDEQIKEVAAARLLQFDSLDERDLIRPILQNFQIQNGRCANAWREILPLLRTQKLSNGKSLRFAADGSPVDPSNSPYLIVNTDGKCDVDLNAGTSKIPYR